MAEYFFHKIWLNFCEATLDLITTPPEVPELFYTKYSLYKDTRQNSGTFQHFWGCKNKIIKNTENLLDINWDLFYMYVLRGLHCVIIVLYK